MVEEEEEEEREEEEEQEAQARESAETMIWRAEVIWAGV